MKEAIFDLETNGLLDEVTTVHCLVINDVNTGMVYRCNNQEDNPDLIDIRQGLALLHGYDRIIGHNIIKYDLPVLKKLYGFEVPVSKVFDTIVASRLIWPDLYDKDAKLVASGKLPKRLTNKYSLEAFGYRLGIHKGDYSGGWEQWSQDMEDYCVQDVEVTSRLYSRIVDDDYSEESLALEMHVAHILARQERHGFKFDNTKAAALYSKLVGIKLEIERELKAVFKPLYLPAGEKVAKRDHKRHGYVADTRRTVVELTEFNPGSRDHIYTWLHRLRGWKPTEFTDNGKPKVDETVLAGLKYPEAVLLKDYFTVDKRISQLAEGGEAWMKRVKADGRIHGTVNTNGAVTGRMTHSYPNMAQVPANYSPYGKECRELFTTTDVLVGADAAALELCCLAGFMAKFDDGAYIKVVLEGDKAQGTDIHSVNARALGLDPKEKYFDGTSGRDLAKTWFYAFIYGAGNEKLGSILTHKKGAAAVRAGKKSREAFMANLPALGTLVAAVQRAAKKGFLWGLDRRRIHVRSAHAALNTLLQSAGAVLMKRALVILDERLQATLTPGVDYEFVANVHDEWQIETKESHSELVGRTAVEAIRLAGESFNFRCPLSGEWRAGKTWADTH